MSAIKQALFQLSRSINNLEGSIDHIENAMKGQQRDMFSAPAKKIANSNTANSELAAKKLDKAIARIETVLKEGRA